MYGVSMVLTDSWSGSYDVIAAIEPNRLPACLLNQPVIYPCIELPNHQTALHCANWINIKHMDKL